jgi:hypothetical protein
VLDILTNIFIMQLFKLLRGSLQDKYITSDLYLILKINLAHEKKNAKYDLDYNYFFLINKIIRYFFFSI